MALEAENKGMFEEAVRLYELAKVSVDILNHRRLLNQLKQQQQQQKKSVFFFFLMSSEPRQGDGADE